MTETTRPSAPTNRYRRTLWQFARFGIVGGSGVAVNMVVAIIMNKLNGGTVNAQQILFGVAGTPYNFRFTSLVWIVGFLVANIWNFQLNRSWTFKSSKHATWFSEFWPFLAVGSAAAAVGLFLKVAFTNPVNLIPAAIGLIMGIANFNFTVGGLSFGGVTVGTVTALVLYHLMKAVAKARGTDIGEDSTALVAEFDDSYVADDAR